MSYEKNKRVQIPGLAFLMFLMIGLFIGFMPFSSTKVYGADAEKMPVDGTCLDGSVSNSSNYYYFEIPENGLVRLGVNNSALSFALYRDAACTNRISLDSKGYADLKAGTYYVKVTGTGTYEISGNFSKAPSYDLEPNDTMETAIPLTSGQLVKGNAYTAFDDVDWYKFTLKAKSFIKIDLNNNRRHALIYDANGTMKDFIYNTVLTTLEAGTYFIQVTSSNPQGYYDMKADFVEYPTPNEITKAVYKGSCEVALTWNKSDYADGYYLFYKTSATGTWQKITTIFSGNTTSYTHFNGPMEGQTYYYGVQAFRKSNVSGEIYNQEDAQGYPVTVPKLPTAMNAKAKNVSNKAILVSWSVSNTADGYYIYRRANGDSYKLAATISSGSAMKWKDTTVKKGIFYTYKIIPYVVPGGEKCLGNEAVTSSLKLTGTLSPVTSVKVKKNKTYNTISWKKNNLAAAYKIYRKEGSGSYKLIKTTTSTSYNDKKVKKGKKYTYKIQAYYKNYTYNTTKKKYTSKTVVSKYSKTVSVKR